MDAPATPVTPPEGTLSADGKLRLFGYKTQPPQPLTPPHMVDLQPMVMTLAPGRYSWCSCGYSKRQPFCDDSHRLEENATNRRSYKFEVLEEAEVAFCMCRQTGNPPYCDNTCKSIAAMAHKTAAAAAPLQPVAAPRLPSVQQAAQSAKAVMVQPTMNPLAALFLLIGRIAMSYIFIQAGIKHLTNLGGTEGAIGGSMPFVPEGMQGVVALLAGLMLLLGGVMLVLGFGTRLGAFLLVLFLIPTLLFFHNFWAKPPEEMGMQLIQFQKNVAMIGGLLAIMAFGGGPLSLDAVYKKKS